MYRWYRLKKIQKTFGSTANFTLAEISNTLVNLWNAKNNLTEEEFYCVCEIYETYKQQKKKLCLDVYSFVDICSDIMANFDLVAPYYKFCGNDTLQLEEILEPEKSKYRARARELIKKNLIFEQEWISLLKNFKKEFRY